MNITITQAAKDWGVSRTTIYQKIDSGELSRNSEKKIDTSEMIRVFGEPNKGEQKNVQYEHISKSVQIPKLNNTNEQKVCSELMHRLEIEKLRNEHLNRQLVFQKELIEDYQHQINQLNKNLAQSVASINEFAQTRLIELKNETEKSSSALPTKVNKKEVSRSANHKNSKLLKKSKLRSIVNIFAGID